MPAASWDRDVGNLKSSTLDTELAYADEQDITSRSYLDAVPTAFGPIKAVPTSLPLHIEVGQIVRLP